MSLPESLAIPKDAEGPVFRAPWEALVFSLVVNACERGLFSWTEWAEALGAVIREAGPADTGERYYAHWAKTLERLLAARGLADAAALEALAAAIAEDSHHHRELQLGSHARQPVARG